MSEPANEVNKLKGRDIAYSIGKGIIESIPIAGAAASELLGMIIAPPLEKRRAAWMQDIGERLQAVEEEGRVDLSTLSENEQFIDVVLQATTLALKTSQQEKLAAFKNIITNTAKGVAPDETKSQIFLSLVDAFTPWHFKVLRLINDPELWKRIYHAQNPNPHFITAASIIADAYPEMEGKYELLVLIWEDLKRAGFHDCSPANMLITEDNVYDHRTRLGEEFIAFISSHD